MFIVDTINQSPLGTKEGEGQKGKRERGERGKEIDGERQRER